MDALEAARGTLRVTEHLFPYEASQPEVSHPILALSGLARCRRLLAGMVEFHDTDHDHDLAGGLARMLFEAWVWSAYLLLDGEEARRRLNANDIFEARRQATDVIDVFGDNPGDEANTVLEGARSVLAATDPADAVDRMNVLDATKKVTELLIARGERVPDYPRRMYAVLYRSESQLSVHWGLQLAKTHLVDGGGGLPVVNAAPSDRGVSDRRLELAASGVLSIATEVATQLELPRDDISAFAQEWFATTVFPTVPPSS